MAGRAPASVDQKRVAAGEAPYLERAGSGVAKGNLLRAGHAGGDGAEIDRNGRVCACTECELTATHAEAFEVGGCGYGLAAGGRGREHRK